MEDLFTAVLAMRKADVKEHPRGVTNFIKKSYSDHPDDWKPFLDQSSEDLIREVEGEKWVIHLNFIKKSYSDHPDDWKPFLDQPIEDLIREVGGEEEIDINFIFINLICEDFENLDGESLKEKLANFNDLNLSDAIVLYIIDCFSLEIEWISRIVTQVDTFSKIGCLTPIPESYPNELQKRMRVLRNKNLVYKRTKFDLDECYDEASTVNVFKRNLRRIAKELVKKKYKEKGRGKSEEARRKKASDTFQKSEISGPDNLSDVHLSSGSKGEG